MSLKKLHYLSRSQLQRIHRLGGVRNANKVLSEMVEYLHTARLQENVYYLNANGRDRVGSTKVLKKTNQIEHYLMRNELYIANGCPSSWKQEIKLTIKGQITIVADALFIRDKTYCICEVDNTQKMSVNREKAKKYRRLVEIANFEKQPKFIWITKTEYRRKQLLVLFEGMQIEVFLTDELK